MVHGGRGDLEVADTDVTPRSRREQRPILRRPVVVLDDLLFLGAMPSSHGGSSH